MIDHAPHTFPHGDWCSLDRLNVANSAKRYCQLAGTCIGKKPVIASNAKFEAFGTAWLGLVTLGSSVSAHHVSDGLYVGAGAGSGWELCIP